jgi:single-strand DNA-binding protein
MAADNHTTIIGNLVEDPEVRFTNTGIAVTNLRVAVTQRIQQDGQWRDGETNFFKVTCGAARPSTWPSPSPRGTG